MEFIEELLLLASRARQEAQLAISQPQRAEIERMAREWERQAGDWLRLLDHGLPANSNEPTRPHPRKVRS